VNTLLDIFVPLGWVGIATLALYLLAELDVFLGMVPEGEIIAVMVSDKVKFYIGNIKGFWVNPETGEVSPDSKIIPPEIESQIPVNILGLGIFWLGVWPFAERYTYEFPRNKYVKKEGSTDYTIEAREDRADSVYFRASYPVVIEADTIEYVPLKLYLLVTTETVNVDQALFKVKSPGWLTALTAAVKATGRDFVGNSTLKAINQLKAEVGGSGTGRSEFQKAIFLLNDNSTGNNSLEVALGQKIISVNFIDYDFSEAKTDPQKAAMKKFDLAMDADAAVEAKRKKDTETDGEENRIRKIGAANAASAQLMTEAVRGNPHAGVIAMAEAIGQQKNLTTLIIGESPVMPTKSI
jgi:hypothetical protein